LASTLIKSIFASESERLHGRKMSMSRKVSEKAARIFAFIQGIEFCEEAILGGLYIQSACLVRQELESVARLEAPGKKLDVKHVKRGLKRTYGDLSEIAHVKPDGALRALAGLETPEGNHYLGIFPTGKQYATNWCLALHVTLCIEVLRHYDQLLAEILGEGMTADNKLMLECASSLLEDGGFLKSESEGGG
jgi:hypothetical protein